MHQARAATPDHNSASKQKDNDESPFKLKPRKQPLLSIPVDKVTFVQKEK